MCWKIYKIIRRKGTSMDLEVIMVRIHSLYSLLNAHGTQRITDERIRSMGYEVEVD